MPIEYVLAIFFGIFIGIIAIVLVIRNVDKDTK